MIIDFELFAFITIIVGVVFGASLLVLFHRVRLISEFFTISQTHRMLRTQPVKKRALKRGRELFAVAKAAEIDVTTVDEDTVSRDNLI